ncbi:uncharacterized protein METZ01_LOCUS83935 [marine metagenome]|uniref:Uncharacterized protein n=1 Tax=marine metagenome TaxID=408172 RepID=A0A381UTL6_9ZZZZ
MPFPGSIKRGQLVHGDRLSAVLMLNLTGQFGGYCNMMVISNDAREISDSNGGMVPIAESG